MCYVLNCERTQLYAWPEKNLSNEHLSQLRELLDKRKLGQPVAYLIQQREFWSLEFKVDERVLVPRPETELIVTLALLAMPVNGSILDAGTGSGVIATALIHQWQSEQANHRVAKQHIVASDYSSAALTLAEHNADKHTPGNINFVRANWLDAFAEDTFGMIISNPPYLAKNDAHLKNKTLKHEPVAALVSGDDGLDDIRKLIKDTCRVGKPGCYLLLEHGATQAAKVCALMQKASYTDVQTHQDFAGLDRVSSGYCP